MVATLEVPSRAEDSPIAVRTMGARHGRGEADLAPESAQEWGAFAASGLVGGVRRFRLGSGSHSIDSLA